jgi:hypothetical protein
VGTRSGGRVFRFSSLWLAALAVGCGGGGAGGSAGGGSSGPSLAVSTTSVELTVDAATLGTPSADFTITVKNAPASGVFIGGSFTANAIVGVSVIDASPTSGIVTVYFQEPRNLGAGVYEDDIQIGICADENCTALKNGTRRTVRTTYTVTGTAPDLTVTPSTTHVEMQAGLTTQAAPHAVVRLMLGGIPSSMIQMPNAQYTQNGILNAIVSTADETEFDVDITFKPPTYVGAGVYEDTVTIVVCREFTCAPLLGSPIVITTRYEVSETVGGENGYTIRPIAVSAVDLAWDEASGRIYLSSPSSAPSNPDSIVALDPVAGEIDAAAFVGSGPTYSAVSDDGHFLYVSLEGSNSIQRMTLPDLGADIEIPMGSYPEGPLYAGEILSIPGAPDSIAVLRNAAQNLTVTYDLVVFDDAVQRPEFVNFVGQFATGSIQFGATPDVIYGGDGTISKFNLDANGVTLESFFEMGAGNSPARIRFDNGVLYTDRGLAIDPVSENLLGTFAMENGEFGLAVVPASDLNRVFFLVNTRYSYVVRSYDLTTFEAIAEVPLYGVTFPVNQQLRMIRWGEAGLAFPTGDGRVMLVTGPFVKPEP